MQKDDMVFILKSPQKPYEFKEDEIVCYCFEYTRKDIEDDYLDNGRSLIFEKIAHEKKAGRCNCDVKNPKGV